MGCFGLVTGPLLDCIQANLCNGSHSAAPGLRRRQLRRSTRQPPPCKQRACTRGRRLHPPPCAVAAQAACCRALARCGAARRLPSARQPLQQARGRRQPAARQGPAYLTPQPTARLAESPTPTATSCSRRTAGASGIPQSTPPIR